MKNKRGKEQTVTVWSKATCSTCQKVNNMLLEAGIVPEFFDYLHEEITIERLQDLIILLEIKPEALVRKKEAIFKEKFAGKKMTDLQWIKAMVKYPILIERPIIIQGNQAFIGRPIEHVLSFCKK